MEPETGVASCNCRARLVGAPSGLGSCTRPPIWTSRPPSNRKRHRHAGSAERAPVQLPPQRCPSEERPEEPAIVVGRAPTLIECLLLVISATSTVCTCAPVLQEASRDSIHQLVSLVDKPVDPLLNRTIDGLLFGADSAARAPLRRFTYNSTIMTTKEKLNLTGMSMAYEGKLKTDPAILLVILYNSSDVLMTRRLDKYYYWEFEQTAGAAIIFCMIVVGNLSILYRLKSYRRRRSNVNYFIVQLAIADLFVGIFNVTLDSVLRLQKQFTYGHFACKASKYISVVFIYSSTYLLVALSIDRWEAVVKPLAFTKNSSRGHYLVSGAWLLAFLSATPVTLRTNIKHMDGLPQCWIDLDSYSWKIYMLYLTCSILVLPVIIIAICYTHIVYTIWSKGRAMAIQERQYQQDLEARQRGAMSNSSSSSVGEPANNEHDNEDDDELGHAHQDELAKVAQEAAPARAVPVLVESSKRRSNLNSPASEELASEVLSEDEQVTSDDDHLKPKRSARSGETRVAGFQLLQTKKRTSAKSSSRAPNEAPTLEGQPKERYSSTQHGHGVIPKARIKTIKMTLVIVATYILCWSPFCIINLCSVFGLMPKDNHSLSIALMTLSQSLAHLNSAVNPIIFWLFSSKRRAGG